MHDYKTHYACFSCRLSFKRHRRGPFNGWVPMPEQALCPNCRGVMRDLGRDFKAPRREDREQWEKVELLYRRGITFDSCGCDGPGKRPRTLREAKDMKGPTPRETEEFDQFMSAVRRARRGG